jgi:hypothetical protein
LDHELQHQQFKTTNSRVRLGRKKNIFSTFKNTLAYYDASELGDRRTGSRLGDTFRKRRPIETSATKKVLEK